jgi:hypothetical protein
MSVAGLQLSGKAAPPAGPELTEEAQTCRARLDADPYVLPNPFAVWISAAVPDTDWNFAGSKVAL